MGTLPRVVVTGIGAEAALGHGVSALWEGALLGLSAIRPVTRFDTKRFHARQAALIDRERGPDGAELETLFARDAAVEALASCPDFGGGRAGIAVGTTLAGNGALTEWLAERTGGAGALSRGDPGALSRDLAHRHGARGPVSTVSVACASGAAAVGLAAGRAEPVLSPGATRVRSPATSLTGTARAAPSRRFPSPVRRARRRSGSPRDGRSRCSRPGRPGCALPRPRSPARRARPRLDGFRRLCVGRGGGRARRGMDSRGARYLGHRGRG